MKKIISTTACFMLVMLLATSCKKTTGPQTYTGVVYDATMNNITLITDKGDTVNISTMDANPQKVPGVLINDSVQVTYDNKEVGGVKVLTATDLSILVHSPYYFIAGTWVEPNPINDKEVQGFTLKDDGTASSVNMATLQFNKWNLDNRTLTLSYTSIGNKQTIEGIDTLHVVRIDADSLILSNPKQIVWKLARQK